MGVKCLAFNKFISRNMIRVGLNINSNKKKYKCSKSFKKFEALFILIHAFIVLSNKIYPQTSECLVNKNKAAYFLNDLKCFKEFDYLQGVPLSNKYSQVKCVKLIYSLVEKRLYYTNSKRYQFHYQFCVDRLGYSGELPKFNKDQYSDAFDREFLLANLNYYPIANKYVLEFFVDDKISPEHIVKLFKAVKASFFLPERLFVLVNGEEMSAKASLFKEMLPLIYPEEIYRSALYQALNKGETYGYLKKIKNYSKDRADIRPDDIVLIQYAPSDIPLIAGIITDQFQTPLSHVNILCHNRKTPNAAIKGSFMSSWCDSLEGHVVHLIVRDDTFFIKKSSEEEMLRYHSRKAIKLNTIALKYDSSIFGLIDIRAISQKSVHVVGGKAAGLGELAHIRVGNEQLPIPENAFAIPFSYYLRHIKIPEFNDSLEQILKSDGVLKDTKLLETRLKYLRQLIRKNPVDTLLLKQVESKMRASKYKAFRFRSSTNSEDISNFNGAGLYNSQTAILDDSLKTIEKAIKQVWASLWNLRAFQERETFHLDHRKVAMGILVHRAFGEESANGVAITRNVYRDDFSGMVINVQKGEVSVVSPPDTVICEQIIINTANVKGWDEPSFEYITRSNLTPLGEVMNKKELLQLTRYLQAIKWHFYRNTPIKGRPTYNDFSMDVEFKLEANTRRIVFKQARPFN